jgi:hypothetical protein
MAGAFFAVAGALPVLVLVFDGEESAKSPWERQAGIDESQSLAIFSCNTKKRL